MRDLRRLSVVKVQEGRSQRVDDDIVIEEPLEVRVNGDSISVTMRTPGDDFDLAIGLLWTYVYIPLPIYGTLWILLIGYITRFLPYGLRTMTSTIVQLHDDLPQASMVCGAGFLTTFRRILLPLLRPGFIAGWIILATIFLREFSTSIFLYSPGSEPLGPLLYHFYVDGNLGPMCSLALIVSVLCITMIVIARKIGQFGSEIEGR